MRWLADECVAAGLVAALRAAGQNVTYVAELHPGISDSDILDLALREQRLLLTEDKDFGEMVFRRGNLAPGLVFVRIDAAKNQLKWPRLHLAINKFGMELLGRYTVIEETRFRSRPLR